MNALCPATALSIDGWDARYAAILAVSSSGEVGAALLDTNGDGVDIDLDQYERDTEGHWRGSEAVAPATRDRRGRRV